MCEREKESEREGGREGGKESVQDCHRDCPCVSFKPLDKEDRLDLLERR